MTVYKKKRYVKYYYNHVNACTQITDQMKINKVCVIGLYR